MKKKAAFTWILLPALVACGSQNDGGGGAGGTTASGGSAGGGGSAIATGGTQTATGGRSTAGAGGNGGSATGGTQTVTGGQAAGGSSGKGGSGTGGSSAGGSGTGGRATGGSQTVTGGQRSGGSTGAGGLTTGGTGTATGGQGPGGAGGVGGLATGGAQTATGGQVGTFDPTKQPPESKAGNPFSPYPSGVVVTKVMHFDVSCWKIAAAGGTLYFENGETGGKTGFDSAFDQAGNDWIGNDADKGYNTSPKGTGKHEYRGWPNFGNGDFDHPQRASGSKTRWVDETGKDVPFTSVLTGSHLIMRSANTKYELEYHFFASHAAIKIIKAADKYAFLYEGPIGGEQEGTDKDKWVLKDGQANGKLCSTTECFSPFIYFEDSNTKDTQVWYIGAKDGTPGKGGDAYVQASNMVVVSYGRFGSYPNDLRAWEGTQAVGVFGFHSKSAGHAAIASFIDARLADPFNEAPTAGVMP
ncbi:MAG: hypothetical protein JXP73_13785 [Deltaproteobacteria bacterium]|nr:hypothetical protein [Deltaproteobacteria bacterium]